MSDDEIRPDADAVAARNELRRIVAPWASPPELVDLAEHIADLAKRAREGPASGRRPGRRPLSQERFWRKYREAVDKAGPDATDVELATGEVFMYADERQFQRYVARLGRPPEYRTE